MQVINVGTDQSGIIKRIKSFSPYDAILEYIWNGFDAGATKIEISYTCNDARELEELKIKDNGKGIVFEDLGISYGKFLSSPKQT